MLTFFTSLSAALAPWFPLLLALLGVGGPLCLFIKGWNDRRLAEINGGFSLQKDEIDFRKAVTLARIAAAGDAGGAQVTEVPKKRRISAGGTPAKAIGRGSGG
jgi:hypothetical protein